MLEAFLAELFANPLFRTFVEGVAAKVVLEILHRRSLDPAYLAKSDAIYQQYLSAKTDEEKLDAHKAFQELMASSH